MDCEAYAERIERLEAGYGFGLCRIAELCDLTVEELVAFRDGTLAHIPEGWHRWSQGCPTAETGAYWLIEAQLAHLQLAAIDVGVARMEELISWACEGTGLTFGRILADNLFPWRVLGTFCDVDGHGRGMCTLASSDRVRDVRRLRCR